MSYRTISELENAPPTTIAAPSYRTIRTTATLYLFCLYNQEGRRGAQFARIARACFGRLERYGVRSRYDITRHEYPGLYNTLAARPAHAAAAAMAGTWAPEQLVKMGVTE